ncbi:hypothetical protein BDQ17DRAFT_217226 [Cyathus striatus]|nr:hypothetical protein BDQ17DRAFT_217226 [Cyathus striatus]
MIAYIAQILIEEASQIEVGDYFLMFYRFQKTIVKLVFIGSDKQLPPYGQSDIDGLKNLFQVRHFLPSAVPSDTQCYSCYRIIDVPSGRETHQTWKELMER